MKWLFPTILSGLVAALWNTFLPAQDTPAPPAQRATNATSDDAIPAPNKSASKPDIPGTLPIPESASQVEEPPKKLIVPVQHRDAAALVELVKGMQPATSGKVFVDIRNNWLIFPEGADQNLLIILDLLDRPASRMTFNPTSSPNSVGQPRPMPDQTIGSDRQAAPAGAARPPEAQEYQQYESQALELANAYRQQQAAAPQDAKKLDQLKTELTAAVDKAFHARQDWQRSQAGQLRTRLEQIDRRVSEREQVGSEIIQRRVEELLHPEHQWEHESDAAGNVRTVLRHDKNPVEKKCWEILGLRLETANVAKLDSFRSRYRGGMRVLDVRPKSVAADSGIKKGDILVGLKTWETVRWYDINFILNESRLINGSEPVKFYVIRGQEVLYGNLKLAQSRAHAPDSIVGDRTINLLQADQAMRATRQFSVDGADDPRKQLLDAEAAVALARAAVTDGTTALEQSELDARHLRALVDRGATTEKSVRQSERDVTTAKTDLDRATRELKIKERSLEFAREMLAVQITLREADLADAKLRMQYADDELSYTASQYGDKHPKFIQKQQEHRLTHGLAASQYARAKTLLDLYRKGPIVDNTRPERKMPSDWKTDLAAAQDTAQKQHRPLIVIFCRFGDQAAHEMRAQVLEAPEVNRIIGERFILVFVDLDAPENSDKLTQFRIDTAPTVLVLGEDGKVLIRSQGELTKKQFLDILNKSMPLPGQKTSIDKDHSIAEPQFKDVWMTDFAASQDKALKLNRPLVVYFWARWSAPGKKMQAEVLAKPELQRIVAKSFIAVTVDCDAVDNRQVLQKYEVNTLPTVLVLDDDGNVLGRDEGFMTAAKVIDRLNKLVPVPRTVAPTEAPAADDLEGSASHEKPRAPRLDSGELGSDEKLDTPSSKPGNRSNAKRDE